MRLCKGISKLLLLCVIALVVLCGALFWYLYGRSPKVRNVVLISIDTCRADYLSCYGFGRKTTPNIDTLAQEGILFENAYAPIPLTLPAHSSMLAGTYPPYHKVHDNFDYKLDESNITIAEILRDKGLATGAIISAYVLYPQFGLAQGFDSYNYTFVDPIMAGTNRDTERRAEEASFFACQYLEENKDRPFFLFLHYYDPHHAYIPPEPFATEYADDPYSGEIAYTDHWLGKVIDKLKSLDLYDSTLIIVVGDHGEALGEHGESAHGYFIYQSCMRVPLIIRAPNLRKPKRIGDIASLVDIVPTILSYLKIDIPGHIQGKDLSVYAKKNLRNDAGRNVYAESLLGTTYGCNPILGLINRRFKYIETTRPELYDLVEDPLEENNLVEKEAKRARLMKEQLKILVDELICGHQIEGRITLDEESRRRLESLGYVGAASVDDSLKLDPNKSDPKDLIEYHRRMQSIMYLSYQEKFEEAKAVCEPLLTEWPEMNYTYFRLTRICYSLRKMEDVIEYGCRYLDLVRDYINLELKPDGLSPTRPVAKTHDLVAGAAYKMEKYDLAMEHWLKALEIECDWPEVHNNIAAVYNEQGKIDKAIYHLREALRLVPDYPDAQENLDKLLYKKKYDGLIAKHKQALEENPNEVKAYDKLAKVYYQYAKFAAAAEYWNKALQLDPEQPNICNNLAWILAAGKDENIWDADRAVELAEQACELTEYKQAAMLDTLSVACAAAGRFPKAIETAKKAIKLAEAAGKKNLAQGIQNRLQLYKINKPYRD